jgi:hypothetical protein
MAKGLLVGLTLLVLLAAGWTWTHRRPAPEPAAVAPPRHHEHRPPHGGTPVVLGDEIYHLELVEDPVQGSLRAYVLDGEMERFIRISAAAIDLKATVDGRRETLKMNAVADSATGERVGDTSLLEGRAPWLKGVTRFQGSIPAIEIRGQRFTGVTFQFPEGNDRDAP